MAGYNEIKGLRVKYLSADPSNAENGQVWYNSTTGNLRVQGIGVGAWVSASSTINAKQRPGGCGTQTAGLAAGGLTAPPASALGTTEEYNGSGWSSGGTLNTARGNVTLFGTQTAAVFSGKGSPSTPYAGTTELYNGTAWTTNPNSANDTYNYRSSCGTNTAGLLSGGNYPPTNRAAGVEEFNGTSFSEGGDLPQKQSSQGQAGTQTAAINSFGSTNSPVPGNSGDGDNAISLEYNGSTWTAGPNGNGVVPLSGFAMGSGTQTDAIFAGGPPTNSCKYDGTTFTVGPALATAQPSSAHGSSSASATWIAHGSPVPSVGTNTQEFNFSSNTFTAGAWASGGALNTGRNNMLVFGTQNAAVGAAGYNHPPGQRAESEEYNGTSWTEGNNVNTARSSGAASGSLTAGIVYAGYTGSNTGVAETYDGTSYTEVNALSTGRRLLAGSTNSPQATATAFGGFVTAASNLTEEYDGTNWTAGGTMSGARYKLGGAGTQTAALAFGGIPAPGGSSQTATEEYNGSSWTAGGALITAANQNAGNGTQTAALSYGGTPNVTTTVGYDGSAWSTRPSLGTGRGYLKGCGTSSSALATGGNNPGSYTTATEEFTGETTAANPASNITTS